MSLIFQQIQNGQVVGNTTAATAADGEAKTKSAMNENKEMFLKLLVAEMQYQDPMEPKDNSEYVKELSQFTEVESLNSIKDEMEFMSAKTLVGKYVSLEDEDGKTTEGKVDYVTTSNGKNYVSVDGNLYEVSTIKSISDSTYFEDTTMADNVEQLISMLPDEAHLTLQDAEKIAQVRQAVDGMTPSAYAYLSGDSLKRLSALEEKIDLLTSRAALYEAEDSQEAKEIREEAEEEAVEEITEEAEEEAEQAIEETDGIVTAEEAVTDETIVVNEVAAEEVDEADTDEDEEEIDKVSDEEETVSQEEALTEDAIVAAGESEESGETEDSGTDSNEGASSQIAADGDVEAEDDYEPEEIAVAEVA